MSHPAIVEPDPTNWDTECINVGNTAKQFGGPIEHGGYRYVVGYRTDHAGTAFKIAVFKSNDAFVTDKHVLDFTNGPSTDLPAAVCYSETDKKFYFANITKGSVVTTTLGAGGTGYAVNDLFSIQAGDGGAFGKVLTVDGSGAVLTYTILTHGQGYTVTNGVATITGGLGTGLTINVTTVTPDTLQLVTFDVTSDSWIALVAGPTVSPAGISISQLSTGDFIIGWTLDIGPPTHTNILQYVRYSGGFGVVITLISVASPRSLKLTTTIAIDSNDTAWFHYRDDSGGFGTSFLQRYVSLTTGGVVTGPVTIFTGSSNIQGGTGGPAIYIPPTSSLFPDTIVWPFTYPETDALGGAINHRARLFILSAVTTAPSLSTVIYDTTGASTDLNEWVTAAFWKDSGGTKFNAAYLFIDNSIIDEQILNRQSNDITTWPVSSTIDWDYLTDPPDPIPGERIPGLEPDNTFAPVWLFGGTTVYGTLLTFFAPICPELYYIEIGNIPAPPAAIMLSMGESMTDVNFPHMS